MSVKAEAGTKVLYTRVPTSLHNALVEVSEISGLSLRTVVEALLAGRLGMDHPVARPVFTAVKKWKGDQT